MEGNCLSSTIKKQFHEIEQLIIHGELKVAHKIIEKGLKTKGINREEELNLLALKSECEFYLGNYQEALQLADRVLKASEGLENILIQLDALIYKSASLIWSAKLQEGVRIAEKGLKIISKTKNLPANKITARKAFLLLWNAAGNYQLGDFEKGFGLFQEALSLAKESGNKLIISLCLNNVAICYLRLRDFKKADDYLQESLTLVNELGNKLLIAYTYICMTYLLSPKREFEQAIEFFEKAFKLSKEIGSTVLFSYKNDLGNTYQSIYQLDKALECYEEALKYNELLRHIVYVNIGYIYFLKYDLEQALKYYLNALSICEKIKEKRIRPELLFNLIIISIELMNITLASQYLEQLEQLGAETGFGNTKRLYRFASILLLKASGGISELGQAVTLLKEFLQEQDLPSYLRLDALYTLLEIHLKELQLSTNKEALNKVNKQAIRLEVEAEEEQQPYLLANVYRLQSQLALVELDINKAIELLDKAQTIADELAIEFLKKEIEKDQDKINQQLTMLQKFQEQKAPLSETVKLVSLESTVKNIKQETVLEDRDEKTGKIIEYRKLYGMKI